MSLRSTAILFTRFGLGQAPDKVRVGVVGGMPGILAAIAGADKVVTV